MNERRGLRFRVRRSAARRVRRLWRRADGAKNGFADGSRRDRPVVEIVVGPAPLASDRSVPLVVGDVERGDRSIAAIHAVPAHGAGRAASLPIPCCHLDCGKVPLERLWRRCRDRAAVDRNDRIVVEPRHFDPFGRQRRTGGNTDQNERRATERQFHGPKEYHRRSNQGTTGAGLRLPMRRHD